MKAIQKRRTFTDPRCKRCGTAPVNYAFRLNDKKRWRIFATCGTCNEPIQDFARNKVPARIKLQINPSGGRFEMKYRTRPSEFEIQAYLYCELRRLGYDVRGEVSTKDGDCRFDLVVFANKKPVRIIEVKSCRKRYRSRQLEQYRAYGIKVLSVCGMSEAIELVRRASVNGGRHSLPLLVGS